MKTDGLAEKGSSCLGAYTLLIGVPYTVRMEQNGNSLTAVVTNPEIGDLPYLDSAKYWGTIDGSSVSIYWKNMEGRVGLPFGPMACADGQPYGMEADGAEGTATISGNTMAGTVAEDYYPAVTVTTKPGSVSFVYNGETLFFTSRFEVTR